VRILLRLFFCSCVVGFVACGNQTTTDDSPPGDTPPGDDGGSDATTDGGFDPDADPDAASHSFVRIAASNTTSGAQTNYEPLESIRLFQGLHPDIVLLQEFRYGTNTDPEIRQFIDTAFGANYNYYREATLAAGDIPNGIVSRFPIVDSGSWDDPLVNNRGFAWAKIAIPNAPHPLWAVALHLLTSSSGNRETEATALVAQIKNVIPASDYLVIGGDFNTSGRGESCITTLSEVVVTAAPYPDDGAGNDNTNAPRSHPFDWVLPDTDLAALMIPVTIGARSFPAGLVFDSRVYQPLADVAPIQMGDSNALNMQHMPVIRDFAFPR
jgi:endonuclease/exonuclease/phosphatase family metal-dependent hydrolase